MEQRINELLDKIKQHNNEYREGKPTITDLEYDSLVDQLHELDPNNDWFNHPEPSVVSNTRKVALPLPMKSLNKVKNLNDLLKWGQSLGLRDDEKIVLMPKFDGLSLLYDEWTHKAYSRGGIENEGQDCTEHIAAANLTEPLNDLFHYTFGEFVISWEDWNKHFKGQISALTGDKFKSPRNTAAGLLNRDNPCDYLKYATFFRYGTDNASLAKYNTFHDFIAYICENYDQPFLFYQTTFGALTEETLMELFKQYSKQFPIDGIVVYLNDLQLWETIGRHQTTGNPLYAIAYKHPDFTATFETTVKGITWKASKSGALKPVVNIETVDTGDCEMENPTGYNAGWICDHNIAKDAKILVTRSGGVIPKILSTIEPAPQAEMEALWDEMSECPHCGAPTGWNENHIELCCTNPNCNGRQLAEIVFFYTTCGAENIGEETLAKIYNTGFTSLYDMLHIDYLALMNIDGFSDGIATIVINNNTKLLEGIDLATLMQASNQFVGIGKVKAQKFIDSLTDEQRENLYDCNLTLHSKFADESKTNAAIYNGLPNFYRWLLNNGLTIQAPIKQQIDTNGSCAGFNVCVSGFRDSQLECDIKQRGGTIVSGVSKKTTHLIVKDKNATSSKISKAQMLGVTIMEIDEFKGQYINLTT